ncbi:hypothetical protein Hanom_Chr17g01576801 [Helianthus anomalus]
MNTYRKGIKGSVVISLLQAKLKMAYEARAMGFECPSWYVNAWEEKLKDLGGNLVEYSAKHVSEEPFKMAEEVSDAGGDAKKDARKDAGADLGAGVGNEAVVEEGATP